MPLFASEYNTGGTAKSNWTMMALLKTFLESNGWVTDLWSAGSRYHFSHPISGAHYDAVSGASSNIVFAGCTGFNSGAAYNAQPGHYGTREVRFANHTVATDFYGFYSCNDDVYVCNIFNSVWSSFAFFSIKNKIGNWTGGFGLGGSLSNSAHFGNSDQMTLLVNGTGRVLYGSHGNNPITYYPMEWNRSSLLVPALICVNDWVETAANKIPVGYLSDFYSCNIGSDFVMNDIVSINGKDHIWTHIGASWCLIKLGY